MPSIARSATPPITPPDMAPTLLFDFPCAPLFVGVEPVDVGEGSEVDEGIKEVEGAANEVEDRDDDDEKDADVCSSLEISWKPRLGDSFSVDV